MAFSNLFLLLLILPSFTPLKALPDPPPSQENIKTMQTLIEQTCSNMAHPKSCISTIQSEYKHVATHHNTHAMIIHAAIKATMNELQRAIEMVSPFTSLSYNPRETMAIGDCKELLDYSMDELGWSLAEMEKIRSGSRRKQNSGNLQAWLSAALSNQDTCLEGFEGTDGRVREYIKGSLEQVTQLVSNVLEMFNSIHSLPLKPARNVSRSKKNPYFPTWVPPEEWQLVGMAPKAMHVDVVVALDGSGRYRSIMEAVNHAPDHSRRRYVIYVKKGVYRENVEMKKKKMNIMLVGDGMGATVVTGSRNFMQGWTTFRTATFAVSGPGFIARDITFSNTAGPENHQAVALRVDSDKSAFFRCSIEGHQDTLYAHSLRQFYRECNIYGTIDFIFGNGAAVLQDCKIFTRKPLPYQKTTITAQGRKNPNQSTGFSIQNSYVYASYPTYLGRPWKQYSRTVFMQTYLNYQVRPEGWLEWAGNFALNTLYYGEYMNYGPGSGLGRRVRWPGYHIIRDASLASFFTVGRFIDGRSWLPATGISFTVGLT
ncbi:putative pectinesterase/pectinesterase inhibitor 22 [Magnolia sinica]|uniref:putative pectinesterase/pectinesterase inhibitor 22 n=1 Tax=Magnolia sinica TaxID=86752 RepID=UPI00265B5F71|nr:putative pectinesterase/pectinesterase inhibitor 22 [Magnolia sinica]